MSKIDWDKRLIESSVAGELSNINYALKKGAYINATNFDGNTPLIISAIKGHLDCLNVLILNHANIEIKNTDGETALMKATFWNRTECLKSLISKNADLYATDHEGYDALMLASLWRVNEAAKILIQADPNIIHTKSKNNRTALDIVIISTDLFERSEKDFAETLIMAGADTRHISPEFKRRYSSFITARHEKNAYFREQFNKKHDATVKTIQTHANKKNKTRLKRRPKPETTTSDIIKKKLYRI